MAETPGQANLGDHANCYSGSQEGYLQEAGWRCAEVDPVRIVPRARNRPKIQLFDGGRLPQDQGDHAEPWHSSAGKRCTQKGVVAINCRQDQPITGHAVAGCWCWSQQHRFEHPSPTLQKARRGHEEPQKTRSRQKLIMHFPLRE